jgi:hypothetical protein
MIVGRQTLYSEDNSDAGATDVAAHGVEDQNNYRICSPESIGARNTACSSRRREQKMKQDEGEEEEGIPTSTGEEALLAREDFIRRWDDCRKNGRS